MIKHKILIFVLVLVLIFTGMAIAQSSVNYVVHHFVLASSGSANSANFALVSVIGQPTTDIASSANFKVLGGFLHPRSTMLSVDKGIWLPVVFK